MKLITLVLFLYISLTSVFAQKRVSGNWQVHASPTTDTLHNAFFVSEQRGWVITHLTGLVLQTIDGGTTWRIQASLGAGYLESIYFVDHNNGWIVGENGRVFTTADSGRSWIKVKAFRATAAFSVIHFFDKNHGLVFGTDTENRKGVAFETYDAGKNWTDRSMELRAETSLSDAVFRFGKTSLLIGGAKFLLIENSKRSFRFSEQSIGGTARGLFFVNRQNGWAVGHRGMVLETKDGGENWVAKPSFTSSILRSVNFIDNKVGWIVGNRDQHGISMWQTTDSGANWCEEERDFPNLHRIVSTKKRLWVVGANGLIFSRSLNRVAGICEDRDDTVKFRLDGQKQIPVGTALHYVKSNIDGTKPEYVSQFISTANTMESFKFHPQEPPAGLVIAEMDWQTFSAKSLTSWRIVSKSERTLFGTILFNGVTRMAEVAIPVVKKESEFIHLRHLPVHLYNFDFGSLNFAFPHLSDPTKSFTIGVADPTFKSDGPLVAYRGKVRISFVTEEKRDGVLTRKYHIDGEGLQNKGGFIWVNKLRNWIEDMEINLPDNPEWTSFKFKLIKKENFTTDEWAKFVSSQL